jgi:hypothetical protein
MPQNTTRPFIATANADAPSSQESNTSFAMKALLLSAIGVIGLIGYFVARNRPMIARRSRRLIRRISRRRNRKR